MMQLARYGKTRGLSIQAATYFHDGDSLQREQKSRRPNHRRTSVSGKRRFIYHDAVVIQQTTQHPKPPPVHPAKYPSAPMSEPHPTPSPADTASVFALHNRLFFRLFQAANALARQTVKEVGLTTVQWAVLGALSRPQVQGGMTFSELADYLVVSRQSLDGVLKRLEREHHVERVADTRDRRARRVLLTPEGSAFWASVQPRIYEFYRQAVDGLRFDDKVALVHFLNRLNEGITDVHVDPATK